LEFFSKESCYDVFFQRINSVEILEPKEKLPPEKKIKKIVEIDDDGLKKLHSYCRLLLSGNWEFHGSFQEVSRSVMALRLEHKLLVELFWLEVKKRYNLMDEDEISIHEGWKLAVLK